MEYGELTTEGDEFINVQLASKHVFFILLALSGFAVGRNEGGVAIIMACCIIAYAINTAHVALVLDGSSFQ